MKKKKTLSSHTKGTVQSIETLLEVLLLSVLYFVFWWRSYDAEYSANFSHNSRYLLAGVYAILTYLFLKNSDGFQFGQLRKADLAVAQWIAMLIVNFITYFQLCLIYNTMISPVPMLLLMLADVVLCFLYINLMKFIYYILYPPYNMVMIYGSKTAAGMKLKMDSRRDKYQVNALISAEKGYDYIIEKLAQYDAVVLNDVPNQLRNDIVKHCYQHRIRVYVVPKITDIILRNGFDITAFDTPLLMVSGQGLTFGQRFLKRAMDIALSAIALIPAAPIMLLVALAIKLEDGGPVFYKQERITLNDRPFYVTKFRSMIVDAEKMTGAVLAADNDPRITKVGKIIRATRLDELPQLLNILKGDMSIVGPRPERMSFIQEFCEEIPEFAYRTKVKAGLTGYAQIYGKYNTCPYDKLRMDLMYIEHYSLQMDIKLILMTVRIIFSKESTEGIDVAEENQKKVDAMLDKLQDEEVCAEDLSSSK
ncbi:MAG: sugar transferase [Oscillospiraceae bacterium]|nr:sugar transferase [Oscillospiraceae bacterium]